MSIGDRQLPLYLSAPHPCSYLEHRQAQTLFADPDQAMDQRTYSELIQLGFRRSGRLVYAPRCPDCGQCISIRIPVATFQPRRIHRRVLRGSPNIQINSVPAGHYDEHYALYQRYTKARHEDGSMADASPQEYLSFLTADWCETRFLEFREHDQLVAVAVTDVVNGGLSAVYTFFDPDCEKRSPGTLAILLQIEQTRSLSLDYLYLGYWVRDCRKMAYKINFRPLQYWHRGAWRPLAAGQSAPDPEIA